MEDPADSVGVALSTRVVRVFPVQHLRLLCGCVNRTGSGHQVQTRDSRYSRELSKY